MLCTRMKITLIFSVYAGLHHVKSSLAPLIEQTAFQKFKSGWLSKDVLQVLFLGSFLQHLSDFRHVLYFLFQSRVQLGCLSWETAHVASLFPAADPKNAAAHFFLPANSHPCSLLQAGQRLPSMQKAIPWDVFLAGSCGRAVPPGPCVLGRARAWRWQGCSMSPSHGCQHCCAAQMCPLWHIVLLAARWLKLCCVLFQGLISFQALDAHVLSPDSRPGHGGAGLGVPQSCCLRQVPDECCWNSSRWKIQFNLRVSVLPQQDNLGPQGVTHFSQNFPGWGSISQPLADTSSLLSLFPTLFSQVLVCPIPHGHEWRNKWETSTP